MFIIFKNEMKRRKVQSQKRKGNILGDTKKGEKKGKVGGGGLLFQSNKEKRNHFPKFVPLLSKSLQDFFFF